MKKAYYFSIIVFLISGCAMNQDREVQNAVPALHEVSGIWVAADTVDMEPSIRNFRGQALLNRDMTSVSWLASAPFSGGYHTGVLRINGETPKAQMFRWMPHQALRKGQMDNWTLYSTVKMQPEKNVLMWQVSISNDHSEEREVDISLDMIGFIASYGGDWQWWYPYPKMTGSTTTRDEEVEMVRKYIGTDTQSITAEVYELVDGKPMPVEKTLHWPDDEEILSAERFETRQAEDVLLISDRETEALTAFICQRTPDQMELKNCGGRAHWKIRLKAGESIDLNYMMAFGDREEEVLDLLSGDGEGFGERFAAVDTIWEHRWHSLFNPQNDLLSGCFPVLETEDAAVRKVYYTGPLTMLYLMHTGLPEHEKVFLTGGPRWGASITFFWDITEWSSLWAVVDPEMMKEHLLAWVKIDPSKHYGKDNFGGKGVGNGYVANYWALFQMLRSYMTTTRDFAILDQEIDGRMLIEHLNDYAMNWKKLSPYGLPGQQEERYRLADFGDDEWNLLECVPTYKHIIPSFNAGYIWMMREMAELWELKDRKDLAASMREEADGMAERVLGLYAGQGVWNSLYPDGKEVEVRHCLDFMFLGRYIPSDIPEDISEEMIDFLYRELMTDHWMRAQSLKDVAARDSDRPDHGPLGAFDGWPAGTMDALYRMGYSQHSLDFYRAIEGVTYEGCWAQAHELWGEEKLEKSSRVRIAQRGWHNRESSGGIAMSQVLLKDFFAFYPDVKGKVLQETGDLDLTGKLYHVLYGGDYYTLELQKGKVKMIKEK